MYINFSEPIIMPPNISEMVPDANISQHTMTSFITETQNYVLQGDFVEHFP